MTVRAPNMSGYEVVQGYARSGTGFDNRKSKVVITGKADGIFTPQEIFDSLPGIISACGGATAFTTLYLDTIRHRILDSKGNGAWQALYTLNLPDSTGGVVNGYSVTSGSHRTIAWPWTTANPALMDSSHLRDSRLEGDASGEAFLFNNLARFAFRIPMLSIRLYYDFYGVPSLTGWETYPKREACVFEMATFSTTYSVHMDSGAEYDSGRGSARRIWKTYMIDPAGWIEPKWNSSTKVWGTKDLYPLT